MFCPIRQAVEATAIIGLRAAAGDETLIEVVEGLPERQRSRLFQNHSNLIANVYGSLDHTTDESD